MDKIKILLVDDKPENLLALESLLKSFEIECFRALSGVQALELLLLHQFALAILDVQMPEMDGFELAELMRGTNSTRSIPIIFVTAGVQDKFNVFRGYEKGAVDFIYKPLDPFVVKCKVQVFIELAKQKQQVLLQLKQTQEALQERDIAMKEAKEALRTRDEFMSIASHELKTPLTSLHLHLQILNQYVLSDFKSTEGKSIEKSLFKKLNSSVKICVKQSAKLSKLIDELLDLTRVRLGRLELSKQEVDLVILVNEVVDRFKEETKRSGIEIKLSAPKSVIGFWDLMRMEQVISNLISNAIKYGDGKPIEIEIKDDKKNQSATLIVRDNGMGIPEQMQEKIFLRFERAISASQISGLGLGLYITKQIVEAHGGKISVQSSEGKGSVFTVDMPLSMEQTETMAFDSKVSG